MDNKKILWTGLAVVAIIAIGYLSFFGNRVPANTNADNQPEQNQAIGSENQTSTTSSITDAEIDNMLNQLNADASLIDQSLNDKPIDVMAE
ncbi:MAG: hypothetical protein WC520_01395 [Candidatus Paceibacterota bacterium]